MKLNDIEVDVTTKSPSNSPAEWTAKWLINTRGYQMFWHWIWNKFHSWDFLFDIV